MLKIEPFVHDGFAEQFVHDFWNSSLPKYIFGRNEYADSISALVDVDGFIDDFTREREYLGKPIVPIEKIPDNSLVVVVVIGKPFKAEKRVRAFIFRSLSYFPFYRYSIKEKKKLLPLKFQENFSKSFYKHRKKFEKIYSFLEDDVSRNQFYNLINFRISFDLYFMRGFSSSEENQYFENFIPSANNEIFVDVGGYDGLSSLNFLKWCNGKYEKILFFEPDMENFKKSQENLLGIERVELYNKGLSDKNEVLKFTGSGSVACVTENGDRYIEVDTLDALVDSPVTFIKMDIEGAEKKALSGSVNIIRRYHPKLAISVYHHVNDFWEIPELIFSIRKDYALYLRHYTEGKDETVMFFIPK